MLNQSAQTVGVIAGGGRLPALIIEALKARKQPFFVITFRGQPQPEVSIPAHQHAQCSLGSVNHVLTLLKEHKVQQVVMAGRLSKPSIFDIKPDWEGVKLLASVRVWHDDALLRAVISLLESRNFTLIPVQSLLPELQMPAADLSRKKPDSGLQKDIAIGQDILKTLSHLDVGQAVIVKDGVVLGIEAIEGTDALIRRCAKLRGQKNGGGVLIKGEKIGQTLVADVPTVGPTTMTLLKEYQYDGLALQAERTFTIDRPEMVRIADEAGLFFTGWQRKNDG